VTDENATPYSGGIWIFRNLSTLSLIILSYKSAYLGEFVKNLHFSRKATAAYSVCFRAARKAQTEPGRLSGIPGTSKQSPDAIPGFPERPNRTRTPFRDSRNVQTEPGCLSGIPGTSKQNPDAFPGFPECPNESAEKSDENTAYNS
jgi:hypothetical protein